MLIKKATHFYLFTFLVKKIPILIPCHSWMLGGREGYAKCSEKCLFSGVMCIPKFRGANYDTVMARGQMNCTLHCEIACPVKFSCVRSVLVLHIFLYFGHFFCFPVLHHSKKKNDYRNDLTRGLFGSEGGSW